MVSRTINGFILLSWFFVSVFFHLASYFDVACETKLASASGSVGVPVYSPAFASTHFAYPSRMARLS